MNQGMGFETEMDFVNGGNVMHARRFDFNIATK
jgi:hypothetical protein